MGGSLSTSRFIVFTHRPAFSGTYVVRAYDLTGHLLQVVSSGKVTGSRVSAEDTVPDGVF
ncbi:MAG TPA: hypothetical protein VGG59_00630 [Acidobacteriaceae bacterium]